MNSEYLVSESIELVREWLKVAALEDGQAPGRQGGVLRELMGDPDGVAFAMRFVDRVLRPDDDRAAAQQLKALLDSGSVPDFLSEVDRWGLWLGGRLGPVIPGIVMPMARRRLRSMVGHLVLDARPGPLGRRIRGLRRSGYAVNVSLLGESILGEGEARRHLHATRDLIEWGGADHVSIRVSGVAAQLNTWDWDGSLDLVRERVRSLIRTASAASPPVFVNLDMEEYQDLEITLAAFRSILSEPAFHHVNAGVVLQAYLPETIRLLRDLVSWATDRHGSGGGEIKVRLVKGSSLHVERLDSAIYNRPQAPYETKAEVDANYKRLVDWVMTPERTRAVRIGIASHNLFDIAWAYLVSRRRGVEDRIEYEMLQGMAPAQAEAVKRTVGDNTLRLYVPVVHPGSFDVAISYLARRLDENTAKGNFLRALFDLSPGSSEFERQAQGFREAVASRWDISDQPRRAGARPLSAESNVRPKDGSFVNEPDTDPVVPSNREWARQTVGRPFEGPTSSLVTSVGEVDRALDRSRRSDWSNTPPERRRELLHRAAEQLARRRGDLVNAMVHEGRKTFAQADPEVSEAIDFARYYGDLALDLNPQDGAVFRPFGVMAVAPPWNFPVAIPGGGTFAALAAGNSVLLKPSDMTPRCAEIVAECAWAAGVPTDALQFLRMPEGQASKHLIVSADGVILTGSGETAQLFYSWKPDMRLFAETSGKNSMIITPLADIDQAVRDLVNSAFSHSGQKCSAASLVICVGPVGRSERFRRQLVDAVNSMTVGPATRLSTGMGPLITPAEGKLLRGLTELEPGEEWLVRPERRNRDATLWSPGIRTGVQPGSWFHQTECFGPVLGVMEAPTLQAAIEFQNSVAFGLTGGLHSLDPDEVETWLEQVEVGVGYVNRGTTGAFVGRQPFGGWKTSNVGPGAKIGGPNYVRQLGTWEASPTEDFLAEAAASDEYWWNRQYSQAHDAAGLFCESNLLRYRTLSSVLIRAGRDASEIELARVRAAADRCGTPYRVSTIDEEDDEAFAAGLAGSDVERIRTIGQVPNGVRIAAHRAGIHVADSPVTANGRVELGNYLKEQTVSRTLHRFGNVLGGGPGQAQPRAAPTTP